MQVKIWHDDIRPAPDDSWTWARTNQEAVHMLLQAQVQGIEVTEMSLDHDLGCDQIEPGPNTHLLAGKSPEGDGVDLVVALLALRLVPPKVTIHSWNPDGSARMAGMLEGMSDAEVIVKRFKPPRLAEVEAFLADLEPNP
jgi:hypothetical protein